MFQLINYCNKKYLVLQMYCTVSTIYILPFLIQYPYVFKTVLQFFIALLSILSSLDRTNIPKEVMSFPDFPFAKHLPSFVHHTEVRKYLEEYCHHFRLWDHIQVQTCLAFFYSYTSLCTLKEYQIKGENTVLLRVFDR